jgi:hypothetical protein
MKAEALIWTKGEGNAEAKSLINPIRKRAGLPENSLATKAELKNQRRCEFAFEFFPSRHLDLVRWKDAQSIYAQPTKGWKVLLSKDAQGNDKFDHVEIVTVREPRVFDPNINQVFPIPAEQVNKVKNLTQNKGY